MFLTAQNGDSRKPEIGLAQTFFASLAEEYLQSEQLRDDTNRLQNRIEYRENHKEMCAVALQHGVPSNNLGLFVDLGQRSFQGGRSVKEMKELKGVPVTANYPDYMGSMELAANTLRMGLTTKGLIFKNIDNQKDAIAHHVKVGSDIRELMRENGALPEDLAVIEPISEVVKRISHLIKEKISNADDKLWEDEEESWGEEANTGLLYSQ